MRSVLDGPELFLNLSVAHRLALTQHQPRAAKDEQGEARDCYGEGRRKRAMARCEHGREDVSEVAEADEGECHNDHAADGKLTSAVPDDLVERADGSGLRPTRVTAF